MAHWAEIDNNNTVVRVTVGSNEEPDEGYQWLIDNLGGTWVKTSYNAIGGKWKNPETNEITENPGFRKNFAGIDYYYDIERDAFIPPKPENINGIEFILNEDTCLWELPESGA
jgi:hypothetical protein